MCKIFKFQQIRNFLGRSRAQQGADRAQIGRSVRCALHLEHELFQRLMSRFHINRAQWTQFRESSFFSECLKRWVNGQFTANYPFTRLKSALCGKGVYDFQAHCALFIWKCVSSRYLRTGYAIGRSVALRPIWCLLRPTAPYKNF